MNIKANDLAVGQVYEFDWFGEVFAYEFVGFWGENEVVYKTGGTLMQTTVKTFLAAINTDAMEVKRVK